MTFQSMMGKQMAIFLGLLYYCKNTYFYFIALLLSRTLLKEGEKRNGELSNEQILVLKQNFSCIVGIFHQVRIKRGECLMLA